MSGLRMQLGLPEIKVAKSTAQTENFGKIFRQRMDRVNRKLRITAAQASPTEHQPLEGQRMQLFKAFQKTTAQIDPADPDKADKAIQRLLDALDVVEGKATETAEGVTAGRDQWLEREMEFDDAMQQIGELEDAKHAKASTLRKFGDVIRNRINDRNFQAAITAFDQLLPKLEKIYAEHQQQTDNDIVDIEPAEVEDKPDAETDADAPREGLTILVKDAESGDSVENAEVQIGDQTDTTSAYGLATVELPVGSHNYKVTAEGFASISDSFEIIEGDNPELVIEMTAGTDAREGLTVLVKDAETGATVENVRVTVGDQSDVTSSNGLATVELAVGTHSYEALGDGYEGARGEVEVIEGDNPELVIEMAGFTGPREGFTILVRDQESGDVIEGADVTIGDQFDLTSSNGLATVELPVGMHSYEATAKNYESQTDKVEVIEGDNPELVIELVYSEECEHDDEGDEGNTDDDADGGDLTDELTDAKRFVGLWNETLAGVAGQVEKLRKAMSSSDDPETRGVYEGLASVMDKFPDLDLRYLVADAEANDQEAFEKTLGQTAREISQVRDLLANGPLLSTIDENPFVKTNVHATVNRVLNEIVDELDVKIKNPKRKKMLAKRKIKRRQLKKIKR